MTFKSSTCMSGLYVTRIVALNWRPAWHCLVINICDLGFGVHPNTTDLVCHVLWKNRTYRMLFILQQILGVSTTDLKIYVDTLIHIFKDLLGGWWDLITPFIFGQKFTTAANNDVLTNPSHCILDHWISWQSLQILWYVVHWITGYTRVFQTEFTATFEAPSINQLALWGAVY